MGNFVNPGILWWLIPLGLAPIIIHLLNRRRYRQVEWAAMDFLLAAYKRTNRRLRLENLLLLILRTVIMILLVMALARPFFSGSPAASLIAQESTKNVIVALDRSYSMRYRDRFSTPFDRALGTCDRLLASLKEDRGDTVSLVLFGNKADTAFEKSLLLGDVRKEMGKIEPSFEATRLATALSEILRLLDTVKNNPEVTIVTDLRSSDWLPSSDAGATDKGAVGELLRRISDAAGSIRIADIGADETANLAVVDLAPRDALVVKGEEITFLCEIANRGERSDGAEATFVVDGAPTYNHPPTTVAGGQSEVLEFKHVFPREGAHHVSVRLTPDQLPVDDERFLAIDVLESVQVLVVDGDAKGESPLDGEVGFLTAALSPVDIDGGDEPGSSGIFHVTKTIDTMFPSRIDEGLQRYDLVVLANLDLVRLPPDRIPKLEEFVRDGGGLLVFMGDRVDSSLYGRLLYKASGEGLLPCLLHGAENSPSAATGSTLAPELEHPVFRLFAGDQVRSLLTDVPVRRFVRAQVPEGSGARVIARYDGPDGPPAVIESGFGFGKVMLVTTTADADWTDWPILPSYLPVIQETARYLTARDPRRRNPRVGEPIQRDLDSFVPGVRALPPAEPGATMRAEAPVSLRELPGREGWFRASYTETRMPGIYLLRADTPFDRYAPQDAPGEDVFAVNVAPDEGVLARVSPDDLQSAYPEVRFVFTSDGEEGSKGTGGQDGEIWKTLVLLLTGCLVTESFLARRFGDYKR